MNEIKRPGSAPGSFLKFYISIGCFIGFLLLILLVKFVDVDAIGPMGTFIGLSGLNGAVAGLLPFNSGFYLVSNIVGYLAFVFVLFFALIGLLQLVKRKSLFKVDGCILALGGLYLALGIVYAFFEKVIVNYRPVIMPGDMVVEASFPSSHTMLAIGIYSSAIIVFDLYLKGEKLGLALRIMCGILMVVLIVSRTLSGVHWITDIIGGILISVALVFLFAGVVEMIYEKERKSYVI